VPAPRKRRSRLADHASGWPDPTADQAHETISASGMKRPSPGTRRHVDRPPRLPRTRRDVLVQRYG